MLKADAPAEVRKVTEEWINSLKLVYIEGAAHSMPPAQVHRLLSALFLAAFEDIPESGREGLKPAGTPPVTVEKSRAHARY